MMIDKNRLAYLAGVSLNEASFGTKKVTQYDVWKASVGDAKIEARSATIVEAVHPSRGVIGYYNTDRRSGWVREDIFDQYDDETEMAMGDDEELAPQPEEELPLNGELDGEMPAEELPPAEAGDDELIFVRQLEDLHKQCSAEVTEILDHFKKDGDYGSRAKEDVDAVLAAYKTLYIALFANH
jgi:hypothetical protein